MWNPERVEACLWFVDNVVKWVPAEKKPVITREWFRAFEEPGLLWGGRVVLTWDADAWQVASAITILGMSPSGTIGKPMDAREDLIRSLQSRGLPVKS